MSISAPSEVAADGPFYFRYTPSISIDGVARKTIPYSLKISGANEQKATVGTEYFAQLIGTGGSPPLKWSLKSGTIPDGVTFNDGVFSGVPRQSGVYSNIVARLSDNRNDYVDSSEMSIVVSEPLSISWPSEFSIATVDMAYSGRLVVNGGNGSYKFQLKQGALPDGLSLINGEIVGVPRKVGKWADIIISVTDSDGRTVDFAGTTITVLNRLVVSGSLSVPGVAGEKYDQRLNAVGGGGIYSWSLSAGGIPNGLSFVDGRIFGTPTKDGNWSFDVNVSDQYGQTIITRSNLTIERPFVRDPKKGEYAAYDHTSWKYINASKTIQIDWMGVRIATIPNTIDVYTNNDGIKYYRGSDCRAYGSLYTYCSIYRTIPK